MKYLPLRRVRLPDAERLLPHLRRIDVNGWYSNYGPLVQEFEAKLAEQFGCRPADVVIVASATVALTLALIGTSRRGRAKCLMPAFTFIATPASAVAAGLEPYFVDIDRGTWSLTPEQAMAVLEERMLRDQVAAVVPVSVFGAPLDIQGWQEFQDKTGIPVVADSAWCFDSIQSGALPQCVSLHATKVFGTGEGGVVVSQNPKTIATVRRLSNFGLGEDRIAVTHGINAKMSEYGAAVGLAGLEIWPDQRLQTIQLQRAYLNSLAALPGVELVPGFGDKWAAGTIAVVTRDHLFDDIKSAFEKYGVEVRPWWGVPCHTHPAFQHCGRGALDTTEWLYRRHFNLPFFLGMSQADVERIAEILDSIVCGA